MIGIGGVGVTCVQQEGFALLRRMRSYEYGMYMYIRTYGYVWAGLVHKSVRSKMMDLGPWEAPLILDPVRFRVS